MHNLICESWTQTLFFTRILEHVNAAFPAPLRASKCGSCTKLLPPGHSDLHAKQDTNTLQIILLRSSLTTFNPSTCILKQVRRLFYPVRLVLQAIIVWTRFVFNIKSTNCLKCRVNNKRLEWSESYKSVSRHRVNTGRVITRCVRCLYVYININIRHVG